MKLNSTMPQILAIETLAKTQIFEIQAVNLRFSNGEERTYERLTPARRASVMMLPIDKNELIMIKEYSVGSERYELTFPKGLLEPNETPEEGANRELQEEIGFIAEKLTPLRALYASPSHMFGLMHIFVAENLHPSQLTSGDEPEPLQIVKIPLTKINELLANPQFAEARNLAALFLLKSYLDLNNF